MSALGWQALLLVPLLAAIVGLARLLRGREDDRPRTPILRFVMASLLAHLGLIFLLDLIVIAVPVVEAHREFLEDVVLKTFSVGPTSRAARPKWEAIPDGPPVASPAPEPAPAAVADRVVSPELRAMRATIPDALARSLPPSRLLFIPRRESPPTETTAPELARSIALAPRMPDLDPPPPLAAVPAVPERGPLTPTVEVERRERELPAGESRFSVPSIAEPKLPDSQPARVAVVPVGSNEIEAPALAIDLSKRPRVIPADDLEPTDLRRADQTAKSPSADPSESAKVLVPPRAAVRELPTTFPAALPREPTAVARLEAPAMAKEPKSATELPSLPLPEPRRPVRAVPVREEAEPAAQFALRRPEVRKEVAPTLGASAASEAAVERGLTWLVAHQGPEGNWSLHQLHCKGHACSEAGDAHSDAAATGLALMSLLGAGHSSNRGGHAESVRRGVAWLISHQREDGALAGPDGAQMYGHGLATIALCEALGLGGDPTLRPPAERALRFIVNAQDPKSGGWRYKPREGGDTSVFGWQVMALKSGEMAGLPVPAEVYDRARKWLDSVGAGPDKLLYGYQPGRNATPSMTAEALLCRQYLGVSRRAETMTIGGDYLKGHLPNWNTRHSYYWYYGAQVMFHLQGDRWAAWNAKLRDMLVGAQDKDGPAAGSWRPQSPTLDKWGKEGGRLYETALSLLMLEVYYRHLPLYQQLGEGPPFGR